MTNLHKKETSIVSITMFFVLAAVTPKPLEASVILHPVLAQSATPTSFPLPTKVSRGTTVRIDGSSSMENVNQALKQRFEKQFSGTKVELKTQGSDAALKALVDGKIDLAAIGRPLTEKEKAQGLVAAPVGRHKIAILVGPNNPFKKSLTFEQFARIFRGQITNWSQVGGPSAPIVLIDRAEGSDTRRAFQSYKVFQTAAFKTGSNVKKINKNSTAEVIKELGKNPNGISYAIADQVLNRKDVRILPMHNVSPANPKYPFSQPLAYIYKKQNPSPAIPAFLGFATATSNKQVVEQAISNTATKIDVADAPKVAPPKGTDASKAAPLIAATDSAEDATSDGIFPWWWLLLLGIPLLGALLWWLLKDRRSQDTPPLVNPVVTKPATTSNAVVKEPTPPKAPVVTVTPAPSKPVATEPTPPKAPLPLVTVTPAPSKPVATEPTPPKAPVVIVTPAPSKPVATEPTPPKVATVPAPTHSNLFLVPYDGKNAYAYWEIAPAHIEDLQRQGGEKLMLRLYDVTGILGPENNKPYCLLHFGCDIQQQYLLLTLPAENREYMAELGYLTQSGNWLPLTRSGMVRVAPTVPKADVVIVDSYKSNGSAALLTNGTGAAVTVGSTSSLYAGDRHSSPPSHTRLFLVPYEGKLAYAYWEIVPAQIEALQRQGGEKLMLRLYDVTDIPNSGVDTAQSLAQVDCDIQQQYVLITLPAENRDYIVELGYHTKAGSWLSLIRSGIVRVVSSLHTDNVVLSLMLRDSKNIYAYWEIPPVAIAAIKHQDEKS